MTDHHENLSRLIPPISRARGFRLYTEKGRRLVDLWQYGGAAILGHTSRGTLRELKNTAERGLFAPLPSRLEGRFLKALGRLFPGREFRWYAGETSLNRVLEAAGYVPGEPLPDPALACLPDRIVPAVSLWRPFLEDLPRGKAKSAPPGTSVPPRPPIPVLIPVLPPPWPPAPRVVVLEPALADRFPPADPLSPLSLGAAARAVHDLIAAAPERGRPFPPIIRALEGSPWRRRGIYLSLRKSPEPDAWEGIFRRFLDQGFLLPPDGGLPAILPGEISPGETAKLAELLAE
ncbi:MAG: hypothetical protein LBP32_00880 [Spirochaetaceae bacterium]|jgi:hypothetical protein|nr:hypothetical protein [Spirochaetaceae bacterium]